MDTKYVPPHKKGRYHCRRQPASVLPSKFLLGGNINDPLNLNSLGQSDNANTPKTSPMPIPKHRLGEVPIFIPKNPTDPLGLQTGTPSPGTGTQIPLVDVHVLGVKTNNCNKHSRRQRRRSLRARNDSESSAGINEEPEDKPNVQPTHCDDHKQGNQASQDCESTSVVENRLDVDLKETPCTDTSVATEASQEEKDIVLSKESTETISDQKEENVSAVSGSGIIQKGSEEAPEVAVSDYGFTRPTSEYVPLSSGYEPSPFVLRGEGVDDYEMITFPFESPSLARLFNSHQSMNEPFSPPAHPNAYLSSRRFPAGHYDYHVQQQTQPSTSFHPQSNPSMASKHKYLTNLTEFHKRHYNRNNRKRFRHNRLDPIVSPVIPQGMKRMRHHHHIHHHLHQQQQQIGSTQVVHQKNETHNVQTGETSSAIIEGPSEQNVERDNAQQVQQTRNPKGQLFQYGNYNRYYGYRNSLSDGDDVRLRLIRKEWIEGKDVLDIGCNVGHVTLSIARNMKPQRIVGIDIDNYLIAAARKNVKHYIDQDPNDVTIRFPQYLPLVYGALQPCPQSSLTSLDSVEKGSVCSGVPFPYNVTFRQENYVVESDVELDSTRPEYDTILCLSVTKWVHLNFGDNGLKRFFKRTFRHLRPGGKFILEPQNWSSYQKKKKLTEKIYATFKEIKFLPDQFQDYLINEIGYENVEAVAIPVHQTKGFQRPILVFSKPTQETPERDQSS